MSDSGTALTEGQLAEFLGTATLILIKTTRLGVIPCKKTSDCLISKRWTYCDANIDHMLPAMQPNQLAPVSSYQLQNVKGTTFREMALAALKAASDMPFDRISTMLKEHRLTCTLPTIEQLVERQERGEDVGLRTDGYSNFAFVENAEGSVSVLYVCRYDRRWSGRLLSLGGGKGWDAGGRLLLCNSDALTL